MKRIITGLILIAMTILTTENTMASAGAAYSQAQIKKIEQLRATGIDRSEMEILKGQNGKNYR